MGWMHFRLLCTLLVFLAGVPSRASVYTYGIIGDAGMRIENVAKVRRSLAHSRIKDLILPGDNIYDTSLSYEQVWDIWKKEGFVFDVVALGNHHKSYGEEMRYFGLPGEYFSKTKGDIRFLVLNSDNVKTAPAQAKWLEAELSTANEPFVFLVYHHPTYNVSGYHHWKERLEFQRAIRPLLQRYKHRITAVLVGHDHVASLVSAGGIPFVVSGAAQGVPSSPPVDYIDEGIAVKTHWMFREGPHWARMDVNTKDNTVWINFVRADRNQVTCSARIYPGDWLLRPNCGENGYKNTRQNPAP